MMVSTWATELSKWKNVENILEISVKCIVMEGVTMHMVFGYSDVLQLFLHSDSVDLES
jgi:hypothetical protein